MRKLIANICTNPIFEKFIITAVFINAITTGLEVSLPGSHPLLPWIIIIDRAFLTVFCIEIALKWLHYREKFLKDPWQVFDLSVVAIALIPASGPLSILRAFRILRALRMISVIPRLRQVVTGLMSSIPGLGAVGGILGLVFYVAAVMATALFGPTHDEWFGTIPKSAYSLFQVMTLESWSMGIVRPIMEEHHWAWLFFVPFIIITTFIMLNLMIAVIVNSMQVESSEAAEEHAQKSQTERKILLTEINKLQCQIQDLKEQVSMSYLTQNYQNDFKDPKDKF